MTKREQWAAENSVQLPPEDFDHGKLSEKVRNAIGAHNKLERLTQRYYNEPTEQVADMILAAAQELKNAWQGK